MGSSSCVFSPMGREGNAVCNGCKGQNDSSVTSGSQDSLVKVTSPDELPHLSWLSAESLTTTLSIGSDGPSIPGRLAVDQFYETTTRGLKSCLQASECTMVTSPSRRFLHTKFDKCNVPSSKGAKRRRRTSVTRGKVPRCCGEKSDILDSAQGTELYLSAPESGSIVEDLTSESRSVRNGDSTANLGFIKEMDQKSGGVSADFPFKCITSRRANRKDNLFEDRGTFLQLGPTDGSNSRSMDHVSKGRSSMCKMDKSDMHLGLAPAIISSELSFYETTSDGVPVVDEGSSSVRMSKTGRSGRGFMPALLMANPIDVDANSHPPLGHHKIFAPQAPFPPDLVAACYLESEDFTRSILASTGNGPSSTNGVSVLLDRAGKVCKFRGCTKGARGASGLCIAHGGGQRCEKGGCSKGAEGRTVYCKAHGGGRRCQNLGCTKSAEGKTDYCIGHGGGRRCSQDGCNKAARGRSGLCIRHGGGKRCLTDGCTRSAEGYSGLCISHGGGRRCHFSGCSKGAQGSTMYCKAHGGGKRCMIQGCDKGAEGSTPLCKGHGGGKRCMYDGGGICTKSVHGGTQFCVAHGGGKRCQIEGCSKSARGRTDFCVRHGGGKRCIVEACGKSAQGSTDFCKAHGGGKRCQWGVKGSGSGFEEPGKGEVCDKFARGKTGLCAAHSAQIQDRRVHGGFGFGPGLTPGLFRGLVSGSGQHRSAMSTSSSGCDSLYRSPGKPASLGYNRCQEDADLNLQVDAVSKRCVGEFLTSLSGKRLEDISGKTSTSSTVELGTSISAGFVVDHTFTSWSGAETPRNSESSASPAFPANFSIGRTLIPPRVLVPLSMQSTDSGRNCQSLLQVAIKE